jgi:phosphate acyltransferase
MLMLRDEILKSFSAKIGYFLARHAFKAFRKRVDYAEYGGAPLLGVDGVGIICHGKSSSQAIKNAILEAAKMVKRNINQDIVESLAASKHVVELEN